MDERPVKWLRQRPEWLLMAIGAFIILVILALGLQISGEEDDSSPVYATGAASVPAGR